MKTQKKIFVPHKKKIRVVVEFGKSLTVTELSQRFYLTETEVDFVLREYVKEPYIIVESKINTNESEERSNGDA